MLCDACLRPFELTGRPSNEELRAIHRAPFVPYGADADAIKEDITDATSELKRLEEEIAQTRTRAKELKSQRRQVESFLALKKAILAPIRRLPSEILVEIFLIASRHVIITTTAGFPWQLAHVCGRWKDIVLSSPVLWSSIALGFPNKSIPEREVTQAHTLFKLCLMRSGEHPLSIHLFVYNKGNTTITRDILNVAWYVRNRWKALTYISVCRFHSFDGWDMFLPPTLDLPVLQHLVLYPSRNLKLSVLSPHLKSLTLDPSPVLSIQTMTRGCPRITCLSLVSVIDPDDFARALLQLPELLELSLSSLGNTNSSSIPVHLDRLLNLKVNIGNPIIGNLTTPCLQTLVLEDHHTVPPSETLSGGQIIINLLRRSACSLTRLILFGRYFSPGDFLGIMGVTPSVKYLDLLIDKRSNVWEHLMYKQDQTLLPRLHTLNLSLVTLPECGDVVRVVKSRADTQLDSKGRSSSLDPVTEGRLQNVSLHLPKLRMNEWPPEVQFLEQLQGFGGLKVDFDGELFSIRCQAGID